MIQNCQNAVVEKIEAQAPPLVNLDADKNAKESLNLQSLFSKRQSPAFLGKDELMQLSHDGTAAKKQADLWKSVNSNTDKGAFGLKELGMLADLESTFYHEGDVFAWNNVKTSHQVGAVGKVKFVPNSANSYTGIFKGADHGLVRFSNPLRPAKDVALIPSFGLKFLRSNMDSANLVSQIKNTDGQEGDWNFFSNDFFNHIGVPKTFGPRALSQYFSTESKYVMYVGLSNFATYDQDGNTEADPKFPFQLRWEAHDAIKNSQVFKDEAKVFEDKLNNGTGNLYYVDIIEKMPADSKLFKVWALDKPTELGGKETYIGDLILDGTITQSKWADQNLYFRHQKMDDDLEIKPEWKPYTHKWESILPSIFSNLEQQDTKGCPFGF